MPYAPSFSFSGPASEELTASVKKLASKRLSDEDIGEHVTSLLLSGQRFADLSHDLSSGLGLSSSMVSALLDDAYALLAPLAAGALTTTTENGAAALTAAGASAGMVAASERGAALTVLSTQLVGSRKAKAGTPEESIRALMQAVLDEASKLESDPAAGEENLADLIVQTFEVLDIQDGHGERMLFIQMYLFLLEKLQATAPNTMLRLLAQVPHYGCWKVLALLYEEAVKRQQAALAGGALNWASTLEALRNRIAWMWGAQLQSDHARMLLEANSPDMEDEGEKPKRKLRLGLAGKWAPRVDGAFDRRTGLARHIVQVMDILRRQLLPTGEPLPTLPPQAGELEVAGVSRPPLQGLCKEEEETPAFKVKGAAQRGAERRYRALLSALNRYLQTVEVTMSNGKWADLDPTRIPSKANFQYKAALQNRKPKKVHKRDAEKDKGKRAGMDVEDRMVNPDRMELAAKVSELAQESAKAAQDARMGKAVEARAKRLKGARLQVYELVNECMEAIKSCPRGNPDPDASDPLLQFGMGGAINPMIEAMYADLYLTLKEKGKFPYAVSLVDVSGSMSGLPMQVAIALGILTAQMQEHDSPWYGKVISFDSTPSWGDISACKTLTSAVHTMSALPWGMSTDFAAAVSMLLETAKAHRLPRDKMPKLLFCFSDMQFDEAAGRNSTKGLPYGSLAGAQVQAAFREEGYEPPSIVFWNLRYSGPPTLQAEADTPGVTMLSGFSQESLRRLCEEGEVAPVADPGMELVPGARGRGAAPPPPGAWDNLRKSLQGERYDRVRVLLMEAGELGYSWSEPEDRKTAGKKRARPAAGAGEPEPEDEDMADE